MTTANRMPASNSYPTREAFAAALQEFINHELPKLHARIRESPNVDRKTPLFTAGLIDSMAILHLIGFIERAAGRNIPSPLVTMKYFQDIEAIAETFWP